MPKTHPAMQHVTTAQAGLELWEFLTPQTTDDAWGDAILTAGTGGIGKLAKNVGKAADVCKGGRCKVCSFTYTTPVLMCDGSLKLIHEVQEGDLVLAQTKETGEIACREVASPYANPGRAIILVTLESVDGETEVIETTDNHPFYVEGRGWTRVDELVPGDLVPSAHSGLLQVVALEWTPTYETVYNFGVDEFYTYFVGELGAWVHNCSNKVPGPRNSISGSRKEALREAKRHNDIAKRTHPDKVYDTRVGYNNHPSMKLDKRNVRMYEYTNDKGEKILIREDRPAKYGDGGEGDQGGHFNSGKASDKKLNDHFYWED